MDDRLKQRLVGAIVIVALAVIVVPVLLDGSGRRGDDKAQFEVPPRPQFPERPLRELGELEAVPKPAAAASAASASPASQAAGATPGAWVIQVGAFSSEANAIVLRDKLRSNGYPAFVEALEETPHFRVRVGPELDKGTAERLRDTLRREYGQAGIVVRYP